MKSWLSGLLLIASGVLLAGLIMLVTAPPRGQEISLNPPPTAAPLLIHVSGAVTYPGVYELPRGARVRDALEIAGGLRKEAQTNGLNLAAELSDGVQIDVAFQETAQNPDAASQPASTVTTATPVPTGVAPIPVGDLININTATLEELDSLPGIGPAIAQRIIDYRTANGDFAAIEDITNVSGIGPSTFTNIQNLITVGP